MCEVVGCELGGDVGEVDAFGAGEVEGALDAGVEDDAVEGGVGFCNTVMDESIGLFGGAGWDWGLTWRPGQGCCRGR